MNRNKLSKDIDKMISALVELESKHNVKMVKVYKALVEAKIEAIIEEAIKEQEEK